MNPLVKDKDYTIIDGVLKINEGVLYIPDSGFRNRTDIKSVVFPSTLISIKSDAFTSCHLKGKLVIPDSVKYIHDFAFSHNEFDSLVIGSNVIYIGEYAFYCNLLKSIKNNSNNIKEIGKNAFLNNECYGSNGLNIYNSLQMDKELISCGYNDKNLYTYKKGVLKIHDGVERLYNFSSLSGCTRIEMPDTVLIIDSYTFNGLKKLKSIRFSNNLIDISKNVFLNCKSLKQNIVLPDSLCYMENDAFEGTNLQEKISVSYNTCVNSWYSIAGVDFYVRDHFIDDINLNENGYAFDINNLLEEEINLLKKYNLLPDNINENKILNKAITKKQSIIMKKALVSFIMTDDYDENINLPYLEGLLKLKEIDVSDMHEAIDYLFKIRQNKTIYLLMSYGYDYRNKSMISKAIISEMYDMVDILLILGVGINEIGSNGMTPLSTACVKGNYEIVKHLIEKGAAINMIDMCNKKAIDYAIENNHQDIVDLINNYGEEKSEAESDLEAISKQLKLGGA